MQRRHVYTPVLSEVPDMVDVWICEGDLEQSFKDTGIQRENLKRWPKILSCAIYIYLKIGSFVLTQ